jgi:hypothetical protein
MTALVSYIVLALVAWWVDGSWKIPLELTF